MLLNQSWSDRRTASPVVLGAGLTGSAISRALSAAGITHVLVGDRPTDTPRLGESLNPEGSLEIARQCPDLARFFFKKERQALFFGAHALAFDFVQYAAGRQYYPLLGYPSTVPLLHVDRIGFDRELFETAIADDHCLYLEDRAAALDYRPCADRIDSVHLAGGGSLAASYVFDATNQVRFLARKLGVAYHRLGEPRRVVFAHYRKTGSGQDSPSPCAWGRTTALLRLDSRRDPVEGLAWCIPLGGYVSVGVSVDPAAVPANPARLLDWVEKAYAARGIDVRGTFPERGAPVDFGYEHYTHQRCYGRNWLLTGPSCCQVWFPSAGGVGSGLVAARLAPDVLKAPAETAALYQAYIDQVAASHAMLEWLAREDPWLVAPDGFRQRGEALSRGNVKRLGRYLSLRERPGELAFGGAFARMYEHDRLQANPLRVAAALPEAQATRLFAKAGEPEPRTDTPVQVPELSRPEGLQGPSAILGLVEVFSGRRDVAASGALVAAGVGMHIDGFTLRGLEPWMAWVSFLRNSRRAAELELVADSLSGSGGQWILTGRWQGLKAGQRKVSPPFSMSFAMAHGRVAEIRMQRADYVFVLGDSILSRVAFAAVLGQSTTVASAPRVGLGRAVATTLPASPLIPFR